MAEELLRSRHAFGDLENLDYAIQQDMVDEFDILFMKDKNGKAVIGWIEKDGTPILVTDEKADLSKVEAGLVEVNAEVDTLGASVETLEVKVDTKANVEDVKAVNVKVDGLDSEIDNLGVTVSKKADDAKVNASYEKVKYEISNAPVGTLVDYRDHEIRVMIPSGSVFTKQTVGAGGDPNAYYMTFKTICTYDNAVGYIEHINGQHDVSVLTDLKTDEYGRRYQPTWLSVANYDETTASWIYRGASSTAEKYIGWDYQIDWYDANGVVIASDMIRINLSNEDCHFAFAPSYVNNAINVANVYTDEQIAKIYSGFQIVEF